MCRTVISILGLFAILFVSARATLGASEKKSAAKFWSADRVHTINIRVSARQWQMMQPVRKGGVPLIAASSMPRPSAQASTRPVLAPGAPATRPAVPQEGARLTPNFYGLEYAYVKASFECDGIVLDDIGLRLRGNSSYSWGGGSGYKRPMKVDFNRYVKGQKLHGLTGFYLNNNAYDPSLLRETLAYETFRALGVPAPRTTFAMVYLTIPGRLDRECLGLYTLIEVIESKEFLKGNFGSSKGMLLKPWSIRGLPYFGEQWQAYASHYNPRTPPTEHAARRAIDFIKLVNYADDKTFEGQVEQYLNVDEFLRLLAGDVILANLDTFLYTGHNFFMYLNPKDDRFYLMPWDMNLSFANFTSAASVEQHLHLSMMRPHLGEMRLIDRLLAVPKYRQMYTSHIQRASETFFSPDKLFPRMDALQGVIAQADAAADAEWKARFTPAKPTTRPVRIPPRPVSVSAGWQGGAAIPLKTFVTRRLASLAAQMAGKTDGFTPGHPQPPSPPPGGLHANPVYGNLPMIAFVVLRSVDTDYDGKLTRDEIMESIRAFFAEIDASHQNSVTQTALVQALTRSIRQAAAPRRDRERGARPQPETAACWSAAVIRTAGGDKADRVTLAQCLAAAEAAFVQADRDKSGKLDNSEVLLLLDSLAATNPPAPAAPPASTTRPAPAKK